MGLEPQNCRNKSGDAPGQFLACGASPSDEALSVGALEPNTLSGLVGFRGLGCRL